jgi:hypothetical protein
MKIHENPIIAIDPGSTESAFIIFTPEKILEFRKVSNESLIRQFIHFHFDFHNPSIGIEMVACYGMPVGREIFDTVFWIGRFFQEWYNLSSTLPLLIYRKEIKTYLCGTTKAKDSNIRQALIDKYGAPGTKKNPGFTYGISKDIWSALAIATYMNEVLL